MNPGICYLYEYKNNQKLRNVGFMKVTPQYHSCILQINARGIPVKNGDVVSLLAFYENGPDSIAKPIENLPCGEKTIYARLSLTDSEYPGGKILDELAGFLLKTENGQYYAALSDNLSFNTEKVKLWTVTQEQSPEIAEKSNMETVEGTAVAEIEPTMDSEPVMEAESVNFFPSAPETTDRDQGPWEVEESQSTEMAETKGSEIIPEAENSDEPESNVATVDEAAVDKAEYEASDESIVSEAEYEASDESTVSEAEYEVSDESTVSETEYDESDGSSETMDMDVSEETAADEFVETNAMEESDTGNPNERFQTLWEEESETQSDYEAAPQNRSGRPTQEIPNETVRKIQRSDLSVLPRRAWNLANNSFLMHGYHNYNHLLLVEEDGHFWLGVPGVYAPREARAAELFGFPQFTQTYADQMNLNDDERDESEKFGHWCRFIR